MWISKPTKHLAKHLHEKINKIIFLNAVNVALISQKLKPVPCAKILTGYLTTIFGHFDWNFVRTMIGMSIDFNQL